jgi:hypothetical protein
VVSNILHFGWTKCANVVVKPFSSASYVCFELAALEDKLLKLILPSPVPREPQGRDSLLPQSAENLMKVAPLEIRIRHAAKLRELARKGL